MPTFLPTTKKELEQLGWNEVDVVLITGDAYVDHPSFGAAVIGRTLEKCGLRVAILPQPNWRDDLRDFKKLGKPRLFFGITAGNMDSMVNHYTANKRLRSDDAYTAGGVSGFRPDYATVVYSNIVRQLFPDSPIVIGGVEASMRRLSHYDYWSDTLKPSVLIESKADILVYGMGEKPITALAEIFKTGDWKTCYKTIQQIAFLEQNVDSYKNTDAVFLHSYETELTSKKNYAEDFVKFETESNKKRQRTLIQPYKTGFVVVNPPFPPATEQEMDTFVHFDSMMNLPHPKYAKRGEIPAFEMIKNSITIHRGCFGGCSFCAIAAHQGKYIASRSEKSILAEVNDLANRDYFKGHISDLGAPSANMYRMGGKDAALCETCPRPSCIFPKVCKNLNFNHQPLIELYRAARKIKNVKQITIGSGIRYDMLLADEKTDRENGLTDYLKEVIAYHVSGRLKVAPEHTAERVLKKMRKPSFDHFLQFLKKFNDINCRTGKNQQLIPYFISSHPNCTVVDMAELAVQAKTQHLPTEQIQDFTPTPMTYSTAMYYLEFDPYSGEKIPVSKKVEEKKMQNMFFFYYKKENRTILKNLLSRLHQNNLIKKLFG
ncbi:MAG: YgiQ family radical SAM protein [Bacteroidales bacterium]|nr:YgiQ family radical SAM protein [Bacteroidales bacterium]